MSAPTCVCSSIHKGSHMMALGKGLPEMVGKALLVLLEPGQSICLEQDLLCTLRKAQATRA